MHMMSRVETFKQGALSFEYERRRYINGRLGKKRRLMTVFSRLGHYIHPQHLVLKSTNLNSRDELVMNS